MEMAMDAEAESPLAGEGKQGEGSSESLPLVVILVGPPGSGKSTFCNDVMAAAHRPWVRICQDVIANGKAGTQSQCLVNAATALKDGKSVFIDRCNLERDQRVEFIKLGSGRADVHAVVLDLPARLCISRSVKRTGHEGNLQGGKAAAVVNRMLQKKEPPNLSEGFSRITFCQNESDVKDAVNTYSSLGPSNNLPPGIYGHKNKEAKVQLGIMKFLKKVDKPGMETTAKNATTDGSNSQNTQPGQGFMNNSDSMGLENINENDKNVGGKRSSDNSFLNGISGNGACTLAFPSISTSDFQFDISKASEIIVDCVAEFLEKIDNARLVLVDLSHKSKILPLVKEKSLKKNIDSSKFFTFVGDITELYTKGNLRCEVIANAANWRLKPGGGGVNAAIFRAAGEALEVATKEQTDTLSPGNSVVIPLPASSPLHLREGVTHVIHVLGPNMNPQRPDCLKNDYVEGCRVLRDAYSSLFKNFACIIKGYKKNDSNSCTNLKKSHEGDQKLKREEFITNESNKKCKGLPAMLSDEKFSMQQGANEFVATGSETSTSSKKNGNLPDRKMSDVMIEKNKSREIIKRSWSSWAQALHEIALHPEKHSSVVLEISDDFIVLNDLYPKAKRHILVVSRLEGLDCLVDVQKDHLSLLKKMHCTGLKWAEEFIKEDPSLIFRLGYHSAPSMRQLHLHVISQDFDSLHLKNKKHWNTFTTSFFRDSAAVIDEIEKHGAAIINDDEKLLKMELRCHRCRSAHPNIPRVKSHVAKCTSSFPSDLEQAGRLVSKSSITRNDS